MLSAHCFFFSTILLFLYLMLLSKVTNFEAAVNFGNFRLLMTKMQICSLKLHSCITMT